MTHILALCKAQLTIGSITVDCYRDNETGFYYLSQNQVTKVIGISHTNVVRGRLPKKLEILLGKDYDVVCGLVSEGEIIRYYH